MFRWKHEIDLNCWDWSCYQETRKSKDCSVIEVEEYDDAAIPMFVKHTEAMLDEIDRMVFLFIKPKHLNKIFQCAWAKGNYH